MNQYIKIALIIIAGIITLGIMAYAYLKEEQEEKRNRQLLLAKSKITHCPCGETLPSKQLHMHEGFFHFYQVDFDEEFICPTCKTKTIY